MGSPESPFGGGGGDGLDLDREGCDAAPQPVEMLWAVCLNSGCGGLRYWEGIFWCHELACVFVLLLVRLCLS